jgi:hypothetical protein
VAIFNITTGILTLGVVLGVIVFLPRYLKLRRSRKWVADEQQRLIDERIAASELRRGIEKGNVVSFPVDIGARKRIERHVLGVPLNIARHMDRLWRRYTGADLFELLPLPDPVTMARLLSDKETSTIRRAENRRQFREMLAILEMHLARVRPQLIEGEMGRFYREELNVRQNLLVLGMNEWMHRLRISSDEQELVRAIVTLERLLKPVVDIRQR